MYFYFFLLSTTLTSNYVIVFLDLPSPWDAIASSKKALKKGRVGRLCSFSPCMEQVIKTVETLKEHGFIGEFFFLVSFLSHLPPPVLFFCLL